MADAAALEIMLGVRRRWRRTAAIVAFLGAALIMLVSAQAPSWAAIVTTITVCIAATGASIRARKATNAAATAAAAWGDLSGLPRPVAVQAYQLLEGARP